jgi:hypothetical protein
MEGIAVFAMTARLRWTGQQGGSQDYWVKLLADPWGIKSRDPDPAEASLKLQFKRCFQNTVRKCFLSMKLALL